DVVTPSTNIKTEETWQLRQSWAAAGKGTADTRPTSITTMTLSFVDPGAPWAKDARFRQAILYGINRENLVETLQSGLTTVAHYFVMPTDPAYALAERRGVMTYPYDPARSQRLFADAGWTKGTDGMLRNSAGES